MPYLTFDWDPVVTVIPATGESATTNDDPLPAGWKDIFHTAPRTAGLLSPANITTVLSISTIFLCATAKEPVAAEVVTVVPLILRNVIFRLLASIELI